jgi:hypothetical protein
MIRPALFALGIGFAGAAYGAEQCVEAALDGFRADDALWDAQMNTTTPSYQDHMARREYWRGQADNSLENAIVVGVPGFILAAGATRRMFHS